MPSLDDYTDAQIAAGQARYERERDEAVRKIGQPAYGTFPAWDQRTDEQKLESVCVQASSDFVPPKTVLVVSNLSDAQKVELWSATGAGWTLTFDGEETDPMPQAISAAQLQDTLNQLPNIDPGDVRVYGPAGGPWTLDFRGQYAEHDVPQLVIGGPSLPTIMEVDIDATGGTFSARPDAAGTTFTLPYNCTAADLQAAMRAHSYWWSEVVVEGAGPGNTAPFTITIGGPDGVGPNGGGWSTEADDTTGGTGVSQSYNQYGGDVTGQVTDWDPAEGDIDLGFHWRGKVVAYKQGGRAHLVGQLTIVDSPNWSAPIFSLPADWIPPENLTGSGEFPVPLMTGHGTLIMYEDDSEGRRYILAMAQREDGTPVTSDDGFVTFDGVSWPLDRVI